MHLHHCAGFSYVHTRDCFPAFTGECQIAAIKSNIYVMFHFDTLYYYYYYYYYSIVMLVSP